MSQLLDTVGSNEPALCLCVAREVLGAVAREVLGAVAREVLGAVACAVLGGCSM